MIKLHIAPNGNQTLTKVCNMCGCHINNLVVEDILVKKPSDARVFDKDGRYYDSNNEFAFHQEGTTWASSLQNTMLLDKSHLVDSDFTGAVIEEMTLDGDGKSGDEYNDEQ